MRWMIVVALLGCQATPEPSSPEADPDCTWCILGTRACTPAGDGIQVCKRGDEEYPCGTWKLDRSCFGHEVCQYLAAVSDDALGNSPLITEPGCEPVSGDAGSGDGDRDDESGAAHPSCPVCGVGNACDDGGHCVKAESWLVAHGRLSSDFDGKIHRFQARGELMSYACGDDSLDAYWDTHPCLLRLSPTSWTDSSAGYPGDVLVVDLSAMVSKLGDADCDGSIVFRGDRFSAGGADCSLEITSRSTGEVGGVFSLSAPVTGHEEDAGLSGVTIDGSFLLKL